MPVGHGIVERIGQRLRNAGLLPGEEVNDSLLVAKTALLDGRLLRELLHYLRFRERQRLQEEWADVLPSREVQQEVLDILDRK